MAKKGEAFDNDGIILEMKTENKKVSIFEALFGIVIGIIGLKIGGDLVVDNSVEIARILGITEKMISLTIVAYSTSYNSNLILLTIGTILLGLFPYIGKKEVMQRSNGLIFVITYALYIGSLIYFA